MKRFQKTTFIITILRIICPAVLAKYIFFWKAGLKVIIWLYWEKHTTLPKKAQKNNIFDFSIAILEKLHSNFPYWKDLLQAFFLFSKKMCIFLRSFTGGYSGEVKFVTDRQTLGFDKP